MKMPATQVFEPDGRAIAYVDEGTGPGLLLIPARGLGAGYLGALAHALADAGHRVVRVGARRLAEDASMHDLAQDVVDVMDHLGLDSAWVGGHAFGGAVARTVSLDHHDRVNGVLLLGVETSPDADADAPEAELGSARDADVEAMQRAAFAAVPESERAALATGIPVLVVQGTEDRINPVAGGAALQAAAPDRVSVVVVEGGGHLFPATHAVATSWAIEDYLDWD